MNQASVREVIDDVSDPSRRMSLLEPENIRAMPVFSFQGAVVDLIGNLALTSETLRGYIGSDLILGETR